jgi:hypothetical protein
VRQASNTAMVTALPDAVAGHRLAGICDDFDAVRMQLNAIGVNPLVAEAFRNRRSKAA